MTTFSPDRKRLEICQILSGIGAAHEARWIVEAAQKKMDFESTVNQIVDRRLKGEPLAYILGEWPFYGRDFCVGPGVLIPRPETEELVEKLLARFTSKHEPCVIVDAGAGSGCIGITVALELKRPVSLTLIERSPEALGLLKENVRRLLGGQSLVTVTVHENSWNTFQADRNVDLFVSNPPYVTAAEFAEVESTVKDFEPASALLPDDVETFPDASGPYRELLTLAGQVLREDGLVAFELGLAQVKWIRNFANTQKLWKNSEMVKDMSDKNRFFFTVRRS